MNHKNTLNVVRKIIVNSEADNEAFAKMCRSFSELDFYISMLECAESRNDTDGIERYHNIINENVTIITVLGMQ